MNIRKHLHSDVAGEYKNELHTQTKTFSEINIVEHNFDFKTSIILNPSKYETLTKLWFTVGPPSTTLAQQ